MKDINAGIKEAMRLVEACAEDLRQDREVSLASLEKTVRETCAMASDLPAPAAADFTPQFTALAVEVEKLQSGLAARKEEIRKKISELNLQVRAYISYKKAEG